MEFIENLGHTVEVKTITLERLSKGGIAVMGTPKLTLEEVNELLGVLFHELHVRGR
jgi:hypothetical protein